MRDVFVVTLNDNVMGVYSNMEAAEECCKRYTWPRLLPSDHRFTLDVLSAGLVHKTLNYSTGRFHRSGYKISERKVES